MQRDHRHAPGTASTGPSAFDRSAVGKHTLTEALPIFQAKGIARQASDAAPPAATGGGRAMPAPVQAKMEHAFGADFSAVRVHEDGAAEAMGAHAFARGSDLHFARGQYAPDSPAGQELLGHELAHVVQQSQGRVGAPAQAKGGRNDDPSLEREADDHGARAARGERVGTGGGGAVPGHAVQAKINYDQTWAKMFGYGAWHAGNEQLWNTVEPAYNTRFLTLIGWIDGDGRPRCDLLVAWAAGCKAGDAATTRLRADLATIRTFTTYDNTNISVLDGQRIQTTLIPLLDFQARLNTWYTTQRAEQQAAANALRSRLNDNTDGTIHADLRLLDDPEGFQPHRTGRETVLRELAVLNGHADPDHIRVQLAAATRNNKSQTYAAWIAELIEAYKTAKEAIAPRKEEGKLERQAKKQREEREVERARARELEARQDRAAQMGKLKQWAGNSLTALGKVFELDELAQLRTQVRVDDVGRLATISAAVTARYVTKPELIALIEAHRSDLSGLVKLHVHGQVGYQLLAAESTIAHANTLLDDAKLRRFLALFGAPAIALAAKDTHAAAFAAFVALEARVSSSAWLAPHFAALVSLHTKVTNTPGVDHFLATYGQAGLAALVHAGGNARGFVDLSVLREQLQAGKGITYLAYQPQAPQTMGAVGSNRRVFADDSAAELAAFHDSYERSDKTLTRQEKLRFMGKKEEDTKSFTGSDWNEFNRLNTWADLESDQRETLEQEDRDEQPRRVHATMQLQLRDGQVVDRPLEVFVSGGGLGSAYKYDGADGTNKQTGQLAEGSSASALTYEVTGQSKKHYQDVGHRHIGHHDGSREHDAEAKIVSQTLAALEQDAETKQLDGATLRIFVDRYTCPSCSDLLYKAKTQNKVFARLAAVEVIYTGART